MSHTVGNVFTAPKLIRPFFACRRSLLGELCRIIARALTQAYGAALPRARPGFILFVQTFGDLVNFNPHVHALVADGVFEASGRFIPLPPIPEALLGERLRREVLGKEALCIMNLCMAASRPGAGRAGASTIRSPWSSAIAPI